MKITIVLASIVAGALLSSPAFAQSKGGGVSSGVHVIPSVPRTGINPVTRPNEPVQSGTTIQNGTTQNGTAVQNGTAIQNGLNGQSAVGQNMGQFSSTTSSNGFVGTNSMAGTNGLPGTNNFAGTNGLGTPNNVTASVTPLTNFPVTVNTNFNGNVVMQDQATTPTDRILLTTLSQGVRASLGIAPNGNSPVHFLIQNGTVTVTGTVQSTAQSQAVLSQVQQTPGVLGVINDTHVSGPFAPAIQNRSTGSLGLAAPTDHAFSAPDQTLLTTVQQEAALQLGVTSTAQMPVHFSIENGVVGITGQVNSLQEKQALIAAINRTPGIARVVDNVGVTPNSATAVSGSAPASATSAFGATPGGNFGSPGNNVLTPTSRSTATNLLPTTNSSGF